MERFKAKLEPVPYGDAKLGAAWRDLSPAHKREHVKHVIEAKHAETRARRIAKTMEVLRAAKPKSDRAKKPRAR
jgi:uncharacterized protein YdeI (YjbR/CyaY-like superfamily)